MINLNPDLSRKKERDPNKTRNEREVTTNVTEIQIILREYYEQLYANKLNNLEEMNKFLETYNISRLDHEDIEKLNRTIARKETENPLTNKSPGTDGFTDKFYQIF